MAFVAVKQKMPLDLFPDLNLRGNSSKNSILGVPAHSLFICSNSLNPVSHLGRRGTTGSLPTGFSTGFVDNPEALRCNQAVA
jgi:hypothetical protein